MGKIYTKKGDNGKSALPGGPIISKANNTFALLGQIDQVNATIGLLACEEIAEYGKNQLFEVQKKLMVIGARVAGIEQGDIKEAISEEDVRLLEEEIDSMTDEMPRLTNFIIPGGSRRSALAHVVRAEVRTLERRLSGYPLDDALISAYINRLSDFFFTLGRYFNYLDDIDDIIW